MPILVGEEARSSGRIHNANVFYALRRWPGEVHVAMVTLHGEQMQQIEEILAEENPAFGKGSAM